VSSQTFCSEWSDDENDLAATRGIGLHKDEDGIELYFGEEMINAVEILKKLRDEDPELQRLYEIEKKEYQEFLTGRLFDISDIEILKGPFRLIDESSRLCEIHREGNV